jgi:hypothetical protein
VTRWELLGQTSTPEANEKMRLARRDDEYVISVKAPRPDEPHAWIGEALATIACRHVRTMKQAARARGRTRHGLHAACDTRFAPAEAA